MLLDGSAVAVRMPKLRAVAVPPTVIVSVVVDDVTVMSPVAGLALAVPPTSAGERGVQIGKRTTLPAPKVTTSGGLAPTVNVSVWPVAAAPCVRMLVALVVPTETPRSVNSASVLAPPMAILVDGVGAGQDEVVVAVETGRDVGRAGLQVDLGHHRPRRCRRRRSQSTCR